MDGQGVVGQGSGRAGEWTGRGVVGQGSGRAGSGRVAGHGQGMIATLALVAVDMWKVQLRC